MKYLEQRLGPEPSADIAKLMTIFGISERDVLAVLVRFALDRMSAEDSSLYFEEYKKTKEDHLHHRQENRSRQFISTPYPYHRRESTEAISDHDSPTDREVRQLRVELAAERHHAYHDHLTGLWNRRAAMQMLDYGIPAAMVALCDIDHFKAINDEYGHEVGDHVLQAVGARLTEAMRGLGSVYRLGGDEFLVLWKDMPAAPMEEAIRLRERVNIELPYHAPQVEQLRWRPANIMIYPKISMGVATLHGGLERSGHILLSVADRAMFEAKRCNDSIILNELVGQLSEV